MGSSGILPASLSKTVSLTEEINGTDNRVQALRAKISRLEADLMSGASSADGHLKVDVPHLLDGNKLGVSVKDLAIESIADPRALQFGWAVGDRVMQVNAFPVCRMDEFANELAKAVSSYQANGKALVFDIWRPPSAKSNAVAPQAAAPFHHHSTPLAPPSGMSGHALSPSSAHRAISPHLHRPLSPHT